MVNKEHQLILACAPLHPSTSPPAPLPGARVAREEELQAIDTLIPQVVDWQALSLLLIDRGTAPLLYRTMSKEQRAKTLPAAALAKLRNAYYHTLSRNTLIYEEYRKLSAIMQQAEIRFIALKGICMAEWLYGDIGLRQMSDIDILIQEKDGHRCLEVLKQSGYVTMQDYTVDEFVDMKSQNHFNPLFRNGVMVEVHIRLQNTREVYQQDLKEIWRNAIPVDPVETPCMASVTETRHATSLRGGALRLELSDMLIHACLHLDKHFATTHVQFTSLNDIVNLLREITSPQPSPEEREIANGQVAANLEGTKKNTEEREIANGQVAANLEGTKIQGIESNLQLNKEQESSILDFEKSIYQAKQRTETLSPSPHGEDWGEVFWSRFESKCIAQGFADYVFTYLVVVVHYYNAPLPQYLVDKYSALLTDEVKTRFENHLSGAGNEFINRTNVNSSIQTHLLHISKLGFEDKLRYLRGVVFPGKEFMVSKYI